ncbi:MAG: hypothetical protein WD793_05540 [Steroidobacteraceae bacterium]
MAATVLNSPHAIEMSAYVVRAFVKLREALASNTELAGRLEGLEKSLATLDARTRKQFAEVYTAMRADDPNRAKSPANRIYRRPGQVERRL